MWSAEGYLEEAVTFINAWKNFRPCIEDSQGLLTFSQESCRSRVVIQKAREIGAKVGVVRNLPQLVAHVEPDRVSTATE